MKKKSIALGFLCLGLLVGSAEAMKKEPWKKQDRPVRLDISVLEKDLKKALDDRDDVKIQSIIAKIGQWYQDYKKYDSKYVIASIKRAGGLTQGQAEALFGGESVEDVFEEVRKPGRKPSRVEFTEDEITVVDEEEMPEVGGGKEDKKFAEWRKNALNWKQNAPSNIKTDLQDAITKANDGTVNELAKMLNNAVVKKDNPALGAMLLELKKPENKKANELLSSHEIMLKVRNYLADMNLRGVLNLPSKIEVSTSKKPLQIEGPKKPVVNEPVVEEVTIVEEQEGLTPLQQAFVKANNGDTADLIAYVNDAPDEEVALIKAEFEKPENAQAKANASVAYDSVKQVRGEL